MIQRIGCLNSKQENGLKQMMYREEYIVPVVRSNLYDSSDAYIHVKATMTVPNAEATGVAVNNTNKKVMF